MSDDLFGFLDANVPRLLTPPAGYEGVHREGNSWARQGDRLSNTSWITPAQWNHLIAQFRALATIEGVDLSDVAQSSPLLLREALLRAIAAILSGEDIGSFGLMEKSVFDPQAIGADVFDRANHMGEQAIATISGLTDALDSKVGVAGNQEIVGYKRFRSSGSIATIAGGGAKLEVFANPSADNAAFMGFHRSGAHAVYVGLDTDNKFKLGGWSLGDNAYEFWHAGNFNPGSYLPLVGGVVSGDLRLNGGVGIGRAPPLVGGLYFHCNNGNPFVVFSGGDALAPTDIAQLRADQSAGTIALTNSALQSLVTFSTSTRLGTVAGDPVAPLGIATKQYVDANAGGVGVGQTWQNVVASRTQNTAYQNTTGKPIFVFIYTSGSAAIPQISNDGTTWHDIGVGQGGVIRGIGSFVVPVNGYYRVDTAGTPTNWLELR